ncbi:MAG TPA: hypothetical protein DCY42_02370 [Chloroflexi bacterium]|nr:hypothetical protein [Chloroflexota bacterium]
MFRYILFIFMIALGAVLGWFYTTEINPVNIVDAPPDTLREDYKTDYVLMVAEVYASEQDPGLAARQLALLGSDQPVEIINQALLFALDHQYLPADLLLMRDLSLVMSTWNPDLEVSQP